MAKSISPEQHLAKLEAKMAKHQALETKRREKMEAARADPLTRFSNAARWRPMSIAWEAEWMRLTREIEFARRACCNHPITEFGCCVGCGANL